MKGGLPIYAANPLAEHPAVKGGEPDATPEGSCHSLLAIPLIQKHGEVEHVTGMLRISNKKGADGKPNDYICFDEQDRLTLTVFAEAAVRALESAKLLRYARQAGKRSGTEEQSL